jgi:hypothetical protein
VALVATELGNNLVRHAQKGRLLVGTVQPDAGAPAVELLAVDEGPGMTDVAACLRDGFSTGSTPGTGLGAVRRLADEFDLFSVPGRGTVVFARVHAQPGTAGARAGAERREVAWGAVALPAHGEWVSGDGWAAAIDGACASLMVVDGLGHGPAAAAAADAAAAGFAEAPFQPLERLLSQLHARLQGTRGAAVLLAHADLQADRIDYCGAGNVAGRLLTAVSDRSLVCQHGTAGLQIRTPLPARVEWPGHALLVMHSDGITARWTLAGTQEIVQRHPAVLAAWLMRDYCRGRDDATVLVLKRSPA